MSVSKKIRFQVFHRDGFACQYCGAKAPGAILHLEHIQPRALGGKDEIGNYLTACSDCNFGKRVQEINWRAVLNPEGPLVEWAREKRFEEIRLEAVQEADIHAAMYDWDAPLWGPL